MSMNPPDAVQVSANKRRGYKVKQSLIGWAQT